MASIGFRSPPTDSLNLSSNNRSRFYSSTTNPKRSTPTRRKSFIVRSLVDNGSETAVEVETTTTKKLPSSLISSANVQKALRGVPITDVDHYGRLGVPRGTSYDQIGIAYQKKSEELRNKGSEEEELNKELALLKESYEILSSEEERRLYDWSLARSEKPDRYVWPFEVDITQTPTQIPPPQEPEDERPTILLGYFFLGWVILSFALSIGLAILSSEG